MIGDGSMNLNEIEELVKIVRGARVSELKLTVGDSTVKLKKPLPPAKLTPKPRKNTASATANTDEKPVADKASEPEETFITAPMVGIFRSAESATVGGVLKLGKSVGVIESMKLMNDVACDCEGVIAEALVDDDMPVEYGQKLFRVQKA